MVMRGGVAVVKYNALRVKSTALPLAPNSKGVDCARAVMCISPSASIKCSATGNIASKLRQAIKMSVRVR